MKMSFSGEKKLEMRVMSVSAQTAIQRDLADVHSTFQEAHPLLSEKSTNQKKANNSKHQSITERFHEIVPLMT